MMQVINIGQRKLFVIMQGCIINLTVLHSFFTVSHPFFKTPRTLLDRAVSMGESPISRALNKPRNIKYVQCQNGHVDSLRLLLFNDNFIKPYSQEQILVHLLTTAL